MLKIDRSRFWIFPVLVLASIVGFIRTVEADAVETPDLARIAAEFSSPSSDYAPWVYWFWNNGNLTGEGIKADLEAMHRVGIKGVLIMEVDQGAPKGPVEYMSDTWRKLFRFMLGEAARLEIKVNMNNGPGWNGSGGPWIKPEDSMQVLAWTEKGFSHRNKTLIQPATALGYYRDIAVLAFPTPADAKSKEPVNANRLRRAKPDPGPLVLRDRVLDVTDKMRPDGYLDWIPDSGRWTILRMGHTCKAQLSYPAPLGCVGYECDKLSPRGSEAAFAGQIRKLIEENKEHVGTTLVSTHIDSWEHGSQDWTARMREEFLQRRGYDLLPYLPVFAGYVIENAETTDRFLWDYRRTVSEMVMEYYARRMSELAREHGLRLSVEAYGSPCDYLEYGGVADEPMGEFWINGKYCKMSAARIMASSGHIYGKPVIGAEAFTADDYERWLAYPGSIKALGDAAFAEGINRFVFHRYSFQPWLKIKPGMMMGPWGVHYERTQTWWDTTPAWHRYLARCQYLLRQGRYAADVCFIEPEDSPQQFADHTTEGYPWDHCGAHAMNMMSVQANRAVLPGGMSYRLLVLPRTEAMTPEFLETILRLTREGVTVLGHRPKTSCGLVDYPNSKNRVVALSDQIWGVHSGGAGSTGQRQVGSGRVVWGMSPSVFLRSDGLPADFDSNDDLNWIHRKIDGADIYFVANPKSYPVSARARFRCSGEPEIWYPETGKRSSLPVVGHDGTVTEIPLFLEATESAFLVFRRAPERTRDPAVSLLRGKTKLFDRNAPWPEFRIEKAVYGVLEDPQSTRDVTEIVRRLFAEDRKIIRAGQVAALAEVPKPSMEKSLRVDYSYDGTIYTVTARNDDPVVIGAKIPKVAVLRAAYGPERDKERTIDVRDSLQRIFDAGENNFLVTKLGRIHDPAPGIVKTLRFEYECDGDKGTWAGDDLSLLKLDFTRNVSLPVRQGTDPSGKPCLELFEPGPYEIRYASGRVVKKEIVLPPPVTVSGAWNVTFPEVGEISFPELISWSESKEDSVRYFSGTAVYRKTIELPGTLRDSGCRVVLDLGRVECVADLKWNGESLGTLWTRTKKLDVTDSVLSGGKNELEIHVTNLWPNRLVGDDRFPEDCERREDGSAVRWPDWVLRQSAPPRGRETFSMWKLWSKEDPLQPSGLIGPVRLYFTKHIHIE